jgi:glycosyltransferase involved in cell wall biosynthesis
LPTYNRAKFLPQAFASIRSQTFTDWELIVVDDGSTDNTRELVQELTRGLPQQVRYHRQENQGPYGARNTGLDLARGDYIAFYDSDDIWLPHHLTDCVAGLEANADVDWVYGACRVVDFATQQTLAPTTFKFKGKPRPFRKLRTRRAGALHIVDDSAALQCMITAGFYCGLQNSVIRRRVFADARFNTRYRNEAEDLLIVIRALAQRRRFAYLDSIHVVYHVHETNSSAAGTGSLEKRLTVYQALLRGFEDIRAEVRLTRAELQALDRSISRVCFWEYGYSLLWQNGRRAEALAAFRKALRLWPWNLACWKTYLLAQVRAGSAHRPHTCVQ